MVRSVPYTSKPPLGAVLNKNHPLAQGLVCASVLNEGGGNLVFDSAYNIQGVQSGTLGWSNHGRACVTRGTNYDNFNLLKTCDRQKFTLFVLCIWDGQTGTQTIAHNGALTSNNQGRIGKGNGDAAWTAGVGAISLNSTSTSVSGKLTSLCLVANNRGDFYVNGVLEASSATTITSQSVTQTKLFSASGDSFTGTVLAQLLFNRALSASEIASLHTNPYQMFSRTVRWGYVASGGSSFTGTLAQIQALQSGAISASLLFSSTAAQEQAAQVESIVSALAFRATSEQTQAPQEGVLQALLSFKGTSTQEQEINAEAIAALLSFSGAADQTQATQAQAIYQALAAITGTVTQTQAAQIAALTASLMFGGTSAQTQEAQTEALVSVLRFAGSGEQAQEAQAEALAGLLTIKGALTQEQAIQLEALVAIASMDIVGTVEQVQEAQRQVAIDFVRAATKIFATISISSPSATISISSPSATISISSPSATISII